jgi:DNA-binding YbaB/EbfC family protein
MFGDMMGKLQEAQQKTEETKKRLDTVYLSEQSNDGKLSITISGNRIIKDIQIDESLLQDPEELSDHLVLTLNKAIAKATAMHESEMQAAAKGMLNMPGLGDLFK